MRCSGCGFGAACEDLTVRRSARAVDGRAPLIHCVCARAHVCNGSLGDGGRRTRVVLTSSLMWSEPKSGRAETISRGPIQAHDALNVPDCVLEAVRAPGAAKQREGHDRALGLSSKDDGRGCRRRARRDETPVKRMLRQNSPSTTNTAGSSTFL